MEYAYEFLQDIAKNQIGEEEYRPWVPYIAVQYSYLSSGANWAGALNSLETNTLTRRVN